MFSNFYNQHYNVEPKIIKVKRTVFSLVNRKNCQQLCKDRGDITVYTYVVVCVYQLHTLNCSGNIASELASKGMVL